MALLVGCIGVAAADLARRSRAPSCRSSPATTFSIGEHHVTAHQVITIAGLGRRRGRPLPAAHPHPDRHRDAGLGRQPRAAPALRRQARPGRRAGLDDRGLAGRRSAASCWSRPSGLDYYALTLLVINAYAAAMLGRLKSLPLTFVGAMGLGLAAVLRRRLRARSTARSRQAARTSSRRCSSSSWSWRCPRRSCGSARSRASSPRRCRRCRRTMGWSAALLLFVAPARRLAVGGQPAAGRHRRDVRDRDALAGAAHRVRRPRLAGAAHLRRRRRARPTPSSTSPTSTACCVSALVAAGVGALVALPVLRLTGLYLALATLAFASIMDKMVFQADFAFGFNGTAAGRAALDPRAPDRLDRRLRLRDGGLPRPDRAGRCCCCAAAWSAGC